MDHTTPQDTPHSKLSDKRPSDHSGSSDQDANRAIRRVRSPSRPRAWFSHSHKPMFAGKFHKYFRRDDHTLNKSGFNNHRYPQAKGKFHFNRREHRMTKHLAAAWRDSDREETFEGRKSREETSLSRQSNNNRAFEPRSSSSRDKDKPFGSKSDNSQTQQSDLRGSRSKERDQGKDEVLQSIASQAAARDRAIQKKRKEIDEVYYQECEMFGLVVKMLIAKDPSLEVPIQASLQQNLRDIGARCVDAMQKFIEEYDSRESFQ